MPMIEITPPPLSAQSLADLLCTIMVICKGKTQRGEHFWAYLCVKPSMAQAFAEARGRGSFCMEDYGTILESGSGEDIPPDIQSRMERDYGVNHHYEDDLQRAIEVLKNDNVF